MSDLRESVVVFDMDGVITDSLPSLYRAYLDFLATYDVVGTPVEFSRLNGPKISEIVEYLRSVHQLQNDCDALQQEYLQCVHTRCQHPPPMAGAVELVHRLYGEKVTMAVASSSPRSMIEQTLSRYGIDECVQWIVSGDDVERAKPEPDIYLAVRQQFPERKLTVIEDSPNGVMAAKRAGLPVIHLSSIEDRSPEADWGCRNMDEVGQVLAERVFGCGVLEHFRTLELQSVAAPATWTEAQLETVERIWKEQQRTRPDLFDGPLFNYVSHTLEEACLTISCVQSSYRNVVAQLVDPSLRRNDRPLAVSGLVVNQFQQVLVGRRRAVSEYDGWLELVPSGGLACESVESQLQQELSEESGIDHSSIVSIDPFCLILDERHGVLDIGCSVQVVVDDLATATEEYESLVWMERESVESVIGSMVPTSVALWLAFQHARKRSE